MKLEVFTQLVISKTKVAQINWLTFPRLEVCGAHLFAQLLHHCKTVFSPPPPPSQASVRLD